MGRTRYLLHAVIEGYSKSYKEIELLELSTGVNTIPHYHTTCYLPKSHSLDKLKDRIPLPKPDMWQSMQA